MRFRTEITNVATLIRLVEAVKGLAKRSVFRFTPDKLHVVVAAGTESGLQVWAHIDVKDVFSAYRIESNLNNEISLELTTAALYTALKSSIVSATDVVLRLAKKGKQPVLSLAIKNTSVHGEEYEVIQDITVRVLKPADLALLQEPMCPDPEVHIVLPSLPQLKSVAEKLGKLATVCTVRANREGEFRVGVESAHAKVETEWRGLRHPEMLPTQASQPAPPPTFAPNVFHEVSIRSKALSTLFAAYAQGKTSIACICANHAAIFYMYLGSHEAPAGVLTAYMPAINEEGDD